jgi:hypothetical protein
MSSVYIELALGLALAFLIFSLLVSGIQEGITRLTGLRAKFLWAYFRDQFDRRTTDTSESRLPSTVPQLAWLTRQSGKADPRPECSNRPASALVADYTSTTEEQHAAAGAAATYLISAEALHERLGEIDRKSWLGRSSISQIPASRFAAAILELGDAAGGVDAWIKQLKAAHTPIFRPMNSAWTSAKGDAQRFSTAVESWFDGEMQRLSRLYRRHIRWIITGIAFVVTLFAGFDSLGYGRALLADAAFRSEAVAVASGNPDKLENLREVCAAQRKGPEVDPYSCVSKVLSDPSLARIFGDALFSADLSTKDSPSFVWNGTAWRNRIQSPAHWIGMVFTIIALLFGAPFWWDVLRRLTGVRSPQSIGSTSR